MRNCTFKFPETEIKGTVPPATAQTLRDRVQCPVTRLNNLSVITTNSHVIKDLWLIHPALLVSRAPDPLSTHPSIIVPLVSGVCARGTWAGWDGRGRRVGFAFWRS